MIRIFVRSLIYHINAEGISRVLSRFGEKVKFENNSAIFVTMYAQLFPLVQVLRCYVPFSAVRPVLLEASVLIVKICTNEPRYKTNT